MPLSAYLRKILDPADIAYLRLSAKKVQRLESHWQRMLWKEFLKMEDRTLQSFTKNGKLPTDISFLEFYVLHYFNITEEGFRGAKRIPEDPREKMMEHARQNLAARRPPAVPRNMADLTALWDLWRKKKRVPRRQKAFAEKVKKEYLRKLRVVFRRHSKELEVGKTSGARAAIHKATQTTFSRAKMIVDTETTRAYNQARRNTYDRSPDVTHYLFVAIRDAATTKWCRTRQGVVYKKGSAVLDKETPPIHWNCRSELLPLTPQNPKHASLINDSSLARANRRPEPLPKGWVAA